MTEVTDQSFAVDVVERSRDVPVVVDLWAEWCGPCRQLGPVLERTVAETQGKVELAKVDVDANPGVAQAFRVQSIPAVFAVVGGQVVDSFVGAQSEAVVREFVERLAPPETEVDRLVAAGDESSLRLALELEPANERAIVALAEVLVGQGGTDEALGLLAKVPETADTRRIAALARTGSGGEADPATGEVETRLAELLDQVKGDDEARREFVDLLEVLGPDHPRTADWRRRLTGRLF